jgi:hypothetical protein
MEKARLFVLYGSFDTAMAALRDLNAAEIGADAVTLLSPHAAGRHGSATVAATKATDIPPDRTSGQNVPSAQVVNVSGIGPVVAIGPLADPLRDRNIVDVLQDRGATVQAAQHTAEGLRRGVSVLVIDAPRSSHERAQAIIDRHHPIGLDSLGQSYLEPGWSRADQIAGDRGVVEVADDLLNVKRPGEDSSAFRSMAPGREELGVSKSGAETPEAGKGEVMGEQGAGPDR